MIALQRFTKPKVIMPLNIVVIGAGLGGLAAALSIKQESPAHDVLVVESAPVLAEVRLVQGIPAVLYSGN
jgi:2-polyprenyl-6-methoxyphenol hydroxylase-like FAD-dependent oxidoreductase